MAKTKKKQSTTKLDLRKEILDVFHKYPRRPLNHKQVASALGISDSGIRTLIFELLNLEAENGKLKEVERGQFVLKEIQTETYQGIIEITRFGRGFVTVDGFEKDIEIAKGNTGFSFYGDTVEVQLNPKARRPEARVIRVVERRRKEYVGIIELSKDHGFFLPSDKKIHSDFYIPKDQIGSAKHGDKVVVEMTGWDNPDKNPFGKVVRVLGKPGNHFVEMHAIIAEFGLPYEFSEEVNRESEKISTTITKEEIAMRRDFREVLTFTIDPFDAKDFDDALSYKKLENGNVEVGIHIADVSHYVLPKTLLEQEAINRATSVYLVDRTIPMLPEKISNELCSLRPNEEKLCFSAVFELDAKAKLKKEWFGRTIILSNRRFTYEEAQEVIETGKGDFAAEVQHLDKLAKLMREQRFVAGAIDFDTEEVKFKLDEKGFPLGVIIKRMKDSNRLIEEFMLLANRKVGEFIGKAKDNQQEKTFVYRVHDLPSEEKLTQLRTFVKHLGYKLPKPTDSNSVGVIRALMDKVAGQPEEDIIKQMAIRSMAKAEYSTKNIGHYGLAFKYYTHFTSPIRRYPDVMAHRLLQHYLDGGKSVSAADYDVKCKHSSLMEKRAAEAERASIKYKQVEYMLMHEGQEFEGIISGLAGWGFYVEVKETKCEGMVPLKTLKDDNYEFDAERYIIKGLRKRREFHLGETVRIRVAGGDLQERKLDYELLG
ncbi:MAG: ribonuclease R [Flavobacteriales bacterium]|nr:ribonuclease R [Flavobacteriales bacterium]